ncbi:hypothetical protein N864_23710 [Intrasporangium chromatireducens Q5-1]|uniref:DUF1232 domain-containing protein n=1 Tax=Intrasporangium chromatireducens Q5-1 TaxID=584657 RepID=W9GIU5_9MICO|nr:DUF1232 domain-containing protein [Intrasporangium chromatireducens]EWT06161.1 hypothetical protein N864_23710 [Intrasporangium chromatireducens Q5-1]
MKRTSRLKLAATVASLVRATTRPGAPTVSERVNAVPRLVRTTLRGTYRGVSRGRLALVVAAVAYVASPVDLLPELVLPVLGLADDALVISWAVRAFLEETDRFLAWELGQGVRPRPTVVPGDVLGGASGEGEPDPGQDRTGAAANGPVRSGGRAVRSAATDYVFESLRKRLER